MTNRVIKTVYNEDITGQKFNMLTAISFSHTIKNRGHFWLFKCDCGNKKIMSKGDVRGGFTKSCGCMKNRIKHGHSNTGIYKIWMGMKERCLNSNHISYKNYGGRGIKVCKRWIKFENFWEDMGGRPEGKSLDRIDNNKGYSKENCRWATQKEQMRNMRTTRFIIYKGKKIPLIDHCEKLGLKYEVIRDRIRRGWDMKKALKTIINK